MSEAAAADRTKSDGPAAPNVGARAPGPDAPPPPPPEVQPIPALAQFWYLLGFLATIAWVFICGWWIYKVAYGLADPGPGHWALRDVEIDRKLVILSFLCGAVGGACGNFYSIMKFSNGMQLDPRAYPPPIALDVAAFALKPLISGVAGIVTLGIVSVGLISFADVKNVGEGAQPEGRVAVRDITMLLAAFASGLSTKQLLEFIARWLGRRLE